MVPLLLAAQHVMLVRLALRIRLPVQTVLQELSVTPGRPRVPIALQVLSA